MFCALSSARPTTGSVERKETVLLAAGDGGMALAHSEETVFGSG